MLKTTRYIIWRTKDDTSSQRPVRTLLRAFPAVQVLQSEDPDYAVVLMDADTEEAIKQALPDLLVEADVQYHLTTR